MGGGGGGRTPDRSDGSDQRGDGAARPAVRRAPPHVRHDGDEPDPARPRARLVVGRGGGRHRARVRAARPRRARGSRLGVRAGRRDRRPPGQRGARGLRRFHRRPARRIGAALRAPSGAAAGPAGRARARGDRRRALGVTGVGPARRRRLQRGARGARRRGADARSVAARRRVAGPAAPAGCGSRWPRGSCPEIEDVVEELGRHRWPWCLSGAGPTILVFEPEEGAVTADALEIRGEWRILRPGVRTTGFELLVEP